MAKNAIVPNRSHFGSHIVQHAREKDSPNAKIDNIRSDITAKAKRTNATASIVNPLVN